jgi:hypothetical protein
VDLELDRVRIADSHRILNAEADELLLLIKGGDEHVDCRRPVRVGRVRIAFADPCRRRPLGIILNPPEIVDEQDQTDEGKRLRQRQRNREPQRVPVERRSPAPPDIPCAEHKGGGGEELPQAFDDRIVGQRRRWPAMLETPEVESVGAHTPLLFSLWSQNAAGGFGVQEEPAE